MTEDAINRYKRNAEAREAGQKKRERSNFKSIVFGLIVVVAIVYWLAYGDSVDWENLSVASVIEACRQRVMPSGASADKSQQAFRTHYMEIALEFAKGELVYWKDAPKRVKPKHAPAGTVYYALVPGERGFDLYQLKGGGVVEEITPFGDPVPTPFERFKVATRGKSYFIASSGQTFVCGDDDLKTMEGLRHALLRGNR